MARLQNKERDFIAAYYHEMGLKAVIIESLWELPKMLLSGRGNSLVLSQSRIVRAFAKCLRFNRRPLGNAPLMAEQYFAMKDAFLLLAKKRIPVFFYNRIGFEKSGFTYSQSAQRRIQLKLNFPKMYEQIDQYQDDLKEIFGDLYSREYVEKIGKIPQVIEKGDVYRHEDMASEYVNTINGERITCYQPQEFKRTIHIYGRCGVFGYAVEDKNTLPSLLQHSLNQQGITDVRVVNHGLWGGTDEYLDHNFLNDAVGMQEGDIVLFYRRHIHKSLLRQWEKTGVQYKEITHEWHQFPEADHCFFDKPGHMNHVGYQYVAELIAKDLISRNFEARLVDGSLLEDFKSTHLKEYLKTHTNSEFKNEIVAYTDHILRQFPLTTETSSCGSIVMNCNPFTKGHRYLIEVAARQVDRLYVFVVEEDKSFFKYEDRFEMVRQGTADLDNVVVISSGKFIISSLTFPEYFMKDYVKEKNFDVSMDVETFCKYIAPPLHITRRFAGEEPFDPVTLNYNENMRRILPKYGMEFCEIPRLAIDEKRVINATEVRRLLKEHDFDAIRDYVPDSTLKILKEKYAN